MRARTGTLSAAAIILVALVPAAALVVYLFLGYAERRSVELTGRNQRALAMVARQLEGRLAAARGAWQVACSTGSIEELEKVALPCLLVEPPPARSEGRCKGVGKAPICPPRRVNGEPTPVITIEAEHGRLDLRSTVTPECDVPCKGYAPLDCFLEAALPVPREFDGLLVATHPDGAVLHQKGSVPAQLVKLTDLTSAHAPHDPGSDAATASRPAEDGRDDVVIAKMRYVSFREFVRLSGTRLVVVGLVSHSRFRSERFAMPFGWLIASVLFLMLALLSWPVLKLWFMGPGERLSAVDARVLVVTSVLSTTLVVGAVYGTFSMKAASRELDERIREMAAWVEKTLRRELRTANRHLTSVARALANEETLRPASKAAAVCPRTVPLRNSPSLLPGPTVLIDGTGTPMCRWEPDFGSTGPALRASDLPSLCVHDRRYFLDARVDRLPWTNIETGATPFTLEVVRSRLNATDLLTLARPLRSPEEGGHSAARVLVTTRESIVFRTPILPVGFHFAIVDPQGKVHLHSDARRNLEENLLQEVDDPTWLSAAIGMRRQQGATVRYGGAEHRAYVHPIAGAPWSVVVLAEEQAFRSVFTDIMTRWATLFLVYLALALALLAGVQAVDERYRAAWIWPDRRGVGTGPYVGVTAAVLALGLGVTAIFERGGFHGRVAVLAFTPIAACLTAYASVRLARRWRTARPVPLPRSPSAERRFRAAYVGMVAALLLVVAGLPAILFWEDATEATLGQLQAVFDQEMRQATDAALHERRQTCADNPGRCPPGTPRLQRARFEWPPLPTHGKGEFRLGLDEHLPVYSALAARLRLVEASTVSPAMLALWSDDPLRLAPAIAWLLVGLGALLLPIGVMWSVVTRLFLLDVDRPDLLDVPPARSTTAVWILRSGGGPIALAPATSPAHAVIDLRWVRTADDLGAWFANARWVGTLQIDHLEARLGDAPWEEQLVAGLEAAQGRAQAVILTSAADPIFHLHERTTLAADAPDPSAKETDAAKPPAVPTIDRWARVLAAFHVERRDLPPAPSGAASTEDPDLRTLRALYPSRWIAPADRAAELDATLQAAHMEIWSTSTPRERLAMVHLAQEGFLNPNDLPTARQLFRRRLVYRDQQFRFATAALKRFARTAEPPERVRTWEKGNAGLWASFGIPLQATLAFVGALLLWTQEELRTATVAIPTVVTSGLPLLINLLGKLGGDSNTPGAARSA